MRIVSTPPASYPDTQEVVRNMKRFKRRPSPALVISLVALFAALGGSAYALTITGASVKNRSLTGVDIKGRSLGGKLMDHDSVGYNAVKEQVLDVKKLKKVPAAANADSVGGATAHRIDPQVLENNTSKPVGTIGPFTLTASCTTTGGVQTAQIGIGTSQNGSAVEGAAIGDDPAKDLSFNSGESQALVAASGALGTPAFDQEPAGAAVAPDGTAIIGQELFAGASVAGQGGKCFVGGIVWEG